MSERGRARGGLAGAGSLEAKVRPGPYKLPDGGLVEVTDDMVVPMGDVQAYRQLTYTHGGNGRPACRIVFEIRGSAPICASFSLNSVNQTAVRAKDLRSFKLDEIRNDVYAYVGVFVPNPAAPGQWMLRVGPGSYHQGRKHVEQAATRRKMGPEFLKQVAEIYNGAPRDGQFDTLRAAFPDREERQVRRYIAAARQKGFLNG